MDYSLLVGIRNLTNDELDNLQPTERRSLFQSLDFGFQPTDNLNQPLPLIYYLGIIDILQTYNFKKKVERTIKGVRHTAEQLSCIEPASYSSRFYNFIMYK